MITISTLQAQVAEGQEEKVIEKTIQETTVEAIPVPEETVASEQAIQEETITEQAELPEEVSEEQPIEGELMKEEVAVPIDSLETAIETEEPMIIIPAVIAPLAVDTVVMDSMILVPAVADPVIDSTEITETPVSVTSIEEVDYNWKEDKSMPIAARAMVSSNGYGLEAVVKALPQLSVRLGYETLNLTIEQTFDISNEQFDADIDYKVGAFNIIADYYFIKNMYIAAGVGSNAFSTSADLKYSNAITFGDLVLQPEDIGTLTLDFEPSNKLSPYLGLGFGRTIGAKKNLAFSFELGAYYQGAIEISATGTNLLEETASDAYNVEGDFEAAIKEYEWMPVLRFGISYKLVDLMKE